MKTDMDYIAEQCAEIDRRQGVKPTSSCTVDFIVVPLSLWERAVRVIETVHNSQKGSCGAIENVYCPPMMNRHGIDNLMNEIRRHNRQPDRKVQP